MRLAPDIEGRRATSGPVQETGVAEATLGWWELLRMVAAVNVLLWCLSAWVWRRAGGSAEFQRFGRWQLLLSAVYVSGCAYRSAMPVFDVPRLVLVDSWWSSVLVGRSVATVAELCFAAQWAVLLAAWAARQGDRGAQWAARVLVPMIALAETCSWTAVLTTSNLGHVLEEALWGLSALAVVAGVVRQEGALARAIAVGGVLYAAYMFTVDVPMYWQRWLADERAGRPLLGLAQGLADVAARWVVSHRWADWRSEVTWMTLYFSVAVWISIGLVHAPRALGAWRPRGTPR